MRRIFEPTAPELIHFGWSHGRFLDAWSLVHLLTGALLGIAAHTLSASFSETLLIVAGLATLYEGAEILLQVSEDAENVLTDIIVTTLGGVLAWHLITSTHPSLTTIFTAAAGIAAVDLFLFSLGWRHYLRKKLYGIHD